MLLKTGEVIYEFNTAFCRISLQNKQLGDCYVSLKDLLCIYDSGLRHGRSVLDVMGRGRAL